MISSHFFGHSAKTPQKWPKTFKHLSISQPKARKPPRTEFYLKDNEKEKDNELNKMMFLGIFLRKNEIKEVEKVFLFQGLNLNMEKTTKKQQ